ncbi:MAG: hypothetical protein OXN83_03600 [Oligoflexia bacterium]|nr:hypothetical protein [Oligoflexia bacterium]
MKLFAVVLFFFNSSASVESTHVKTQELNSSANNQNLEIPQAVSLKSAVSGKEYLVKKLDYLNQTLPKGYRAKKALNLRLAHALSLIAEENFIKHEKEKCSECLQIAQDSARRSLSLYKQLDSALLSHSLLHTTALFKQAYLERFLGSKKKSLFHLKRIALKKNIPALFTARAWYNIGEIYFELYDYSHSLMAYNQVLKVKSPWEFRAVYRKIWSLFNLSLYQQSIKELITFLKSSLYVGVKQDNQPLKQQLESELLTLYSYAPMTSQNLDFLYHFDKQAQAENTVSARNQRFFNLARALNRIGRLKESNEVWTAYLSKTSLSEERLLAYSFMLDNDLVLSDTNQLNKVGKKIEKILALQKQVPKYKEEISKKIRQFFSQVGEKSILNSKEKKEYLLSLYQQYHSIYPKNVRVLLATADLAENLGKYALAGELLRASVSYMKKPERVEDLSVKQMAIAELTKNEDIRLKAYKFYIENGRKPSLIFKAKYQIAYIAYSNKEFKKASDLFNKLALSEIKEPVQELQLKSANLSLSALAQLGNQEEQLIQQAGLFMKRFPESRQEFARIYNLAILNTVKKLVYDKDFSYRPIQASSDKNILKAWEVLQTFSVKDSSKESRTSYYLDQLLLAKELLKFKQMDQSLKFLLSDKSLNEEDKKVALTWQLWLAELRFDFKEVLRIVKILNPSTQSEEDLLRLARLSELAKSDPTPYYKAFIKSFPNSPSSPAVLTSLIEKLSSNKEKKDLLQKYFALYKKDINKLTYLILKLDKGQLDSNFVGFFTKLSFMKNTFLAAFEQRRNVIEAFTKDLQKINQYSLSSRLSRSRLNFRLKSWTKEIDELQKKAENLLKTQDWTAQIFILSHWKKELERFYLSVMSLPVPKGLTEKEQKEYKALLASQMQVYSSQIKQMENELNRLWSRDFLSDYSIGLRQNTVFYPPLKWELDKLAELAKGEQKEQIQSLLSSLTNGMKGREAERTTQAETEAVKGLYETLRQNPFDEKSLTELLNLEKKNEALSFYLANRIEELKQEGRGNHL